VSRPVYLVRHTRPAVGTQLCYGRLDVELAPTWQFDIAQCVASIGRAACVYTSPATRCRRLAEAVGRRDLSEVRVDGRLSELDFADWEGRRWEEIPRSCLDDWAADIIHYAPGNGEPLWALWARVDAFRAELPPAQGPIVVVSHHGPLRALAAQLADESPDRMFTRRFPWGSVTRMELPRTSADR